MPQALPHDWAFVNAQAAAANQANVYAQAHVLAQVQAVQAAQAQAVALEQHQQQQQQQQAFIMQQHLQQQQYSPYAQQLVALASQQHHQSSRRQGRGLPPQSSWPQDAHQKREARKQPVEKQRTMRSRDDPPDWRRIFVGNIGWWVNEAMLHQWFSAYGTVIDTQVSWGKIS
jgi:hypothetical protein